MHRDLFNEDHEAYRDVVREFVRREVTPNLERWDAQRLIDRQVWHGAGKHGIIGLGVPERFGGAGQPDYRFRTVVIDELARAGASSLVSSFSLQDDIVLPYVIDLASDEQKLRWLPKLASGEAIGAIAMTEPEAGSDLQGIRTSAARSGDDWVLNGEKTFITSGAAEGVCDI